MSVTETKERANPYLGAVVRSTAGRDRNRVFIVTDVTLNGSMILLTTVNGSLRRVGGGKKKNAKHVEIIGRLTDEQWQSFLDRPDDGTAGRLAALFDGGPGKTLKNEQSPDSGA